jgi:TRAP-type C4-dicarboxylate transport system permease large subunit
MNLFVIVSVDGRVKFEAVAAGVLPFLVADMVRLTLLVCLPILTLFLPKLIMG